MLQTTVYLIPSGDMLIVMGDWNAKIDKKEDPGISGKWGLDERNERGEKLINFCT